jgi:Cytochrome P460
MVHRIGVLLLVLSLVKLAQPLLSDDNSAPTTDRVGFPDGYEQSYTVLRSFVKEKQQQLVTVYGNRLAASVTEIRQLPYPFGSILVMETADLLKSGKKNKGKVLGLHVMRREPGFGASYGKNRTGEWEYVEYRADKSYITPPQSSSVCAECHVKAGLDRDFVYRGRFGETSR